MPRFSDSPYFLLKDYFKETDISDKPRRYNALYNWIAKCLSLLYINGEWVTNDTNYTLEDVLPDDVFGVFIEWYTNTWNLDFAYEPDVAQTDGSYLIGLKCNVLTSGYGLHKLYVKDEDVGYMPISVRYIDVKDNDFNYINSGVNEYNPGDTITEIVSGSMYYFDYWDKTIKYDFNDIDSNQEVYFRKDSLYHNWLSQNANGYYQTIWDQNLTIRNYVNTDVMFSYFGKIYKQAYKPEYCRILFNGMKDFTVNAIPEHQRTPNFKEMLKIFFDRTYQQNYNLLKNIYTLIDPMEIDSKYLGYLSQYFNMHDLPRTNELRIREWVKYLPWLLKRKGTHAEFIILWKILAVTTNRLNIYEKWHNKNITGNVPTSAWESYRYVDKPEYEHLEHTDGAGEGWYKSYYPTTIENYEATNKILSTHYRLEFDLNNESLSDENILSKNMWDYLYTQFEYLRPINRVSDYRILFSPITNFSGYYFSLYDDPQKTTYCKSKSFGTELLEQNAYVYVQMDTPSNTWMIQHNLNSINIITQAFDENINEIIPIDIQYIDSNNIKVTFADDEYGYLLCRKADTAIKRYEPIFSDTWVIQHFRDDKNCIVQFHDGEFKIVATETELIDVNTAKTIIDKQPNIAMISKNNYIGVQSIPETSWTINHNINKKGVISAVYGFDNKQIYPENFTILDPGVIRLEFDEPTAGFVVLYAVGNLSWEDIMTEFESQLINPTWRIGDNIGDLEDNIIMDSGVVNDLIEDDEYYYFDFTLPKNKMYMDINEIAIYNDLNDQILYTKCSDLYKPSGVDLFIHYRLKKTLENI